MYTDDFAARKSNLYPLWTLFGLHCGEVLVLLAPKNFGRNSLWYADHFATKNEQVFDPLQTPFALAFLGGSSAASPLKIWDMTSPLPEDTF